MPLQPVSAMGKWPVIESPPDERSAYGYRLSRCRRVPTQITANEEVDRTRYGRPGRHERHQGHGDAWFTVGCAAARSQVDPIPPPTRPDAPLYHDRPRPEVELVDMNPAKSTRKPKLLVLNPARTRHSHQTEHYDEQRTHSKCSLAGIKSTASAPRTHVGFSADISLRFFHTRGTGSTNGRWFIHRHGRKSRLRHLHRQISTKQTSTPQSESTSMLTIHPKNTVRPQRTNGNFALSRIRNRSPRKLHRITEVQLVNPVAIANIIQEFAFVDLIPPMTNAHRLGCRWPNRQGPAAVFTGPNRSMSEWHCPHDQLYDFGVNAATDRVCALPSLPKHRRTLPGGKKRSHNPAHAFAEMDKIAFI